jgi:hypothetical protein
MQNSEHVEVVVVGSDVHYPSRADTDILWSTSPFFRVSVGSFSRDLFVFAHWAYYLEHCQFSWCSVACVCGYLRSKALRLSCSQHHHLECSRLTRMASFLALRWWKTKKKGTSLQSVLHFVRMPRLLMFHCLSGFFWSFV